MFIGNLKADVNPTVKCFSLWRRLTVSEPRTSSVQIVEQDYMDCCHNDAKANGVMKEFVLPFPVMSLDDRIFVCDSFCVTNEWL